MDMVRCWRESGVVVVVRWCGETAAGGRYLGYLPVLCVEAANGKQDPRQGFVRLTNLGPGDSQGQGTWAGSQQRGGRGLGSKMGNEGLPHTSSDKWRGHGDACSPASASMLG